MNDYKIGDLFFAINAHGTHPLYYFYVIKSINKDGIVEVYNLCLNSVINKSYDGSRMTILDLDRLLSKRYFRQEVKNDRK